MLHAPVRHGAVDDHFARVHFDRHFRGIDESRLHQALAEVFADALVRALVAFRPAFHARALLRPARLRPVRFALRAVSAVRAVTGVRAVALRARFAFAAAVTALPALAGRAVAAAAGISPLCPVPAAVRPVAAAASRRMAGMRAVVAREPVTRPAFVPAAALRAVTRLRPITGLQARAAGLAAVTVRA